VASDDERERDNAAGGFAEAGYRALAGGVGKESKRFFFEKKQQKTFSCCGLWHLPGQRPQERKFFCFFFFKKRSS
jgi:hypothetical protein